MAVVGQSIIIRFLLASLLATQYSQCCHANTAGQSRPKNGDPSSPGKASPHASANLQERFSSWAHGLPHAFTAKRASMLWADFKQFISLFNIMVLGPYHRALYSSWTKFTWRLARYLSLTARTVAAARERAQRGHAWVLSHVLEAISRKPALSKVLRSVQLVELFLLYGYSAVLALTVACIIGTCNARRRNR